MDRYETRIDDDVLSLVGDAGEIEVGTMTDVCDLLGETYELEYDEREQAAAWLRTDDDGGISFDVRETVADMDFDEQFVERIADASIDRTDAEGYPERTVAFADLLDEIWASKGAFEYDED